MLRMSYRFAEKPLAYSLPHEWGHFSVTPAADTAHQLQPLTPDIVQGGTDRASLPKNATEILLVGPEELVDWDTVTTQPKEEAISRIMISPLVTATRGVQIVCSIERTRQQILDDELQKQAQANNTDMKTLLTSFKSEAGLPVIEAINQQVNKDIVHTLLYPVMITCLAEAYQQRRRFMPLAFMLSDVAKAEKVVDDIHADLCSDIFDQKNKENLESSN